jgi:phage terminase large subunit-like protein
MITTETTAYRQLGTVELELIRVLEGGMPSGAYEDWGKADLYCLRVLSGEILVSKWVKQAVERHAKDLVRSQSANSEVFYSRKHGEHALRWLAKNATITEDGFGVKVGDKLVLQPWQRAFISILFGWRRVDGTDNGQRRFRNVYAELARGNGKSKLFSAIALYILVGEKVKGAAVYSIATTMEQAGVVFNDAALMAAANKPDLRNLVRNKNLLYIPGTATVFRPLASNEHNLDGLKPSAIVIDELHAHRSRGPWNKCKTAQGKKPGSMMLAITTAGYDRHSVCYEQRSYAENVVDGTYDDDSYFVWIAALDKDDDPFDPLNWYKANPNLGISIELQTLEDAAKQAQLIPTEYNEFLRLRCNIWTDSSVRWMPMAHWDACKGACDLEALKGRPCFGGMDVSTVTDISAFVLVFPPYDDDPMWRIVPYFFVPLDNVAERVKKDKVPYDVWIKKGLIIATPGPVIDFDFIREHIVSLADTYDIKQIAYDPWNAHQLVTQLTQAGMKMAMMRQGFISLNSPMKTLMEKTLKAEIAHGDHPVLRWMVSNTVAGIDSKGSTGNTDSSAIKPDKEKSTEKIDGVVAAIMALGLAVLNPIKKKKKPFKPQVWS